MNEKVQRECPACGRNYDADPTRLKHGRQTACSRACSYRLRAAGLQDREEYECGACGERFSRSPAQVKARHGVQFCSRACAYSRRVRVVERPYVLVAEVDRQRIAQKIWETRRRNPKPYPEAARQKAAARAVERLKHGGGVSKFERKAAEVFRALGFAVESSVAIRDRGGRFLHVIDILLPGRRLAVECHGTYWHGGRWTWDAPDATQAKNLAYEERKARVARALGLDLRVLWEHDFKKDPRGACLAVVR